MNKQGALMSGLYFLIAWILTCALLPMPLNMFSWMAYVLIGGVSLHVTLTVTFSRRLHRGIVKY